MRALVLGSVVVGSMALLAACSSEPDVDTAERNAAIANFTPPSVTSRSDFGGVIERRFNALDIDGDLRLERRELPERYADRMLERWDANEDGVLDSEEWGTLMLDRFDAIDANDDDTVTTQERQAEREQRRREQQRTSPEVDSALDEASNVGR